MQTYLLLHTTHLHHLFLPPPPPHLLTPHHPFPCGSQHSMRGKYLKLSIEVPLLLFPSHYCKSNNFKIDQLEIDLSICETLLGTCCTALLSPLFLSDINNGFSLSSRFIRLLPPSSLLSSQPSCLCFVGYQSWYVFVSTTRSPFHFAALCFNNQMVFSSHAKLKSVMKRRKEGEI